jgi:hypothetical protein
VTLSHGILAKGAHHALDMDEAGMRLTLDIVAQVMLDTVAKTCFPMLGNPVKAHKSSCRPHSSMIHMLSTLPRTPSSVHYLVL